MGESHATSYVSVWGYEVSVKRSTAQFLDITAARTDGRARSPSLAAARSP
jgi:hypothetical protein